MEVEQFTWKEGRGWKPSLDTASAKKDDLVLVFGDREILSQHGERIVGELTQQWPGAVVAGVSTAGEIRGNRIKSNRIVATVCQFERSKSRASLANVDDYPSLAACCDALMTQLPLTGLRHILVFADGLALNGSELVASLAACLPSNVGVTGGLAADGERFQQCLVVTNELISARHILLIGLYGDIEVGVGCYSGFEPFGVKREVTKAEGNVLYELDGESALTLYKKYLGEFAHDLPASGLLFPLLVESDEHPAGVVRSVLSIDEDQGALVFAGSVPVGSNARLMSASLERLVTGAEQAALDAAAELPNREVNLAIVVSCVGRRIVLGQRSEDELDVVQDVLGKRTGIAGFYSYGEIAPAADAVKSELHNQTMTITLLRESKPK